MVQELSCHVETNHFQNRSSRLVETYNSIQKFIQKKVDNKEFEIDLFGEELFTKENTY